jgi:hypothetical protein
MNAFKEKLEVFLGKDEEIKDVKNLSEITNPKQLMYFWKKTSSGTNLKKKIEKQMTKIYPSFLSEIYDPEELIKLWENTSPGSKAEALIEKQMKRAYTKILPKISDPEKLIELWENSSNDKLRKMIEKQMEKVFSGIDDFDWLFDLQENVPPKTGPKEIIEEQIKTVISETLPDISDVDELMDLWEKTPANSELKKKIEAQIINNFSTNEIYSEF